MMTPTASYSSKSGAHITFRDEGATGPRLVNLQVYPSTSYRFLPWTVEWSESHKSGSIHVKTGCKTRNEAARLATAWAMAGAASL